jgi:hypothetical protein
MNTYAGVLSSAQNPLFQSVPVVYTYNELDYGGNSQDSTGKAIRTAYQTIFPSYPLPSTTPGIYQQFYIGSVLVLVTDSRAFINADSSTIFGATQKKWLVDNINAAAADNTVKGVIVLFTQEWFYNSTAYDMDIIKQDRLSYNGNFDSEKKEIAKAISNLNFNNPLVSNFKSFLMIGGDARMLAFDNGINNNFGAFPYLVCGSMDQKTNCWGGPYSHGYFYYETGQYCKVTLYQSSSGNVCYMIQGIYNSNNATQVVLQYDTCNPAKYPANINVKCPILWQEKLIIAAIAIGAALFIFILFYVIFYRIAVYNFNYKVIRDEEVIPDRQEYSKIKNEKTD